ncbi:OmpA/MotB domain protein (plasmid) [Granulicella tundricola MP5ACTX9]|uniref:OmpA/MotB domain protein n=1 Tax=Granulicella tundricola (strain ATCC BAA-1859 / DSM 23138 / MP5ACTX9) TaxID=1198114 RepID=E8X608_GRATM|nr:OmpA/MotB domain protein [Granulicella tundricola MP5ACTX9]
MGEAGPSHDRWLISYADLVTLLFAVFVVLFAYSWHSKQAIRTVSTAIRSGFDSMSAAQTETAPETPVPDQLRGPTQSADPLRFDTAKLSQQLQGVLGDAIDKHEIVMQQTADGFIISLRELGFFNSGEATLLPGAAAKLQDTAKVLMEDGLEVRVEGHSDDQPIHNGQFQSNWELSTARAMSVLSLLVDEAGFPPTKISVAGYGPYHPVADNATLDGRRSNRRVDLVVLSPRSREEKLH